MPATIPCLRFDGTAVPAVERYLSLFPGAGVDAVVPGGPDGAPATVVFTLDGRQYVASNTPTGVPSDGPGAMQVICADQDEVDHYWDGLLADGGQEGVGGWLQDPWGTAWHVAPRQLFDLIASAPDPATVERVVAVVRSAGRIVVAELEAAAANVPS